MTTLFKIESSWVHYAIKTPSKLFLVLNNKIYSYSDIDEYIFEEFLNEYSKGFYLNTYKKCIFNDYQCIGEIKDLTKVKEVLEKITNTTITEYKYIKRGNM